MFAVRAPIASVNYFAPMVGNPRLGYRIVIRHFRQPREIGRLNGEVIELLQQLAAMYSKQELANDFCKLGIKAGDTVMLHASVRAVGEVAGGPDAIHLALKSALTPEGTLMMYASCPQYCDEVGRGNLTANQEHELLEKLPAFDPVTARAARDNGALVELFRTYPGSRVNSHMARFVFWGKQTDWLMSTQPWNYALGKNSALERFLHLDGKIVLLGSDRDAVTFLHYVEHVADFTGKRILRYQVPVLENGSRVWR